MTRYNALQTIGLAVLLAPDAAAGLAEAPEATDKAEQKRRAEQAEKDKAAHNEAVEIAAELLGIGVAFSLKPTQRGGADIEAGQAADIVAVLGKSISADGTDRDKAIARARAMRGKVARIVEHVNRQIDLLEMATQAGIAKQEGVFADAPRQCLAEFVAPMLGVSKTATQQKAEAYTGREIAAKK